MAPTPRQIAVALDALEADAVRWDRAARDVLAAAAAARRPVDPAAFSFAGQEVAAAHAALSTRMAALLEAGSANFGAISTALRAAAAAYAADEAAGAHRMQNVY